MSNDPSVSLPPPAATPAPWGLLGTIVWGAAGLCAWFAVQFAVIVAVVVWRDSTAPGSVDMQKMATDGFLLGFITIVAAPAWIGVAVLAARLRGWRARDYLALVPPRRGEIVVGGDPALLAIYSECLGADVRQQLERAENWLAQHPRDAVLLLTLGRLCAHQGLWGKARSYLEASLSIEPE